MQKLEERVCGCGCGYSTSNEPLLKLHELVEKLEREEAIRKAIEKQRLLGAASRHMLGDNEEGSVVA